MIGIEHKGPGLLKISIWDLIQLIRLSSKEDYYQQKSAVDASIFIYKAQLNCDGTDLRLFWRFPLSFLPANYCPETVSWSHSWNNYHRARTKLNRYNQVFGRCYISDLLRRNRNMEQKWLHRIISLSIVIPFRCLTVMTSTYPAFK